MRGFPAIPSDETHRVRRWDAVVIGGALPGLIAAARIGQAGRRVLLVEEAGARKRYPGLREPFHPGGAGPDHVLGAMLRDLSIPLIDQRLLIPQDEALQIVLPDARIDVGASSDFATELEAWRLAAADESGPALRALEDAGAAERRALLLAPLVRAGRRRPFSSARIARGRAATDAEGGRGMPRELARGPASLRLLCDILVRALGNHAERPPAPEASARLLGSALEDSYFVSGDGGLHGILERRLQALGVERRELSGELRFVSVAGQPGLAPSDSEEIWSGRSMILNAHLPALGRVCQGAVPDALTPREATHKRVCLHYRTPRELLPESMGDRVVLVPDPAQPIRSMLLIRTFPGPEDSADLVLSTLIRAEDDTEPVLERMQDAIRRLLPFSDETLLPQPIAPLRWDHDDEVEDLASAGWPREVELRVSSRPTVYALDRRAVLSLGAEGDLLLGWRAGDAIASALT